MYNCRNCGGNLRFDIPTQRLKCPYCESDYDCYEIDEEMEPGDTETTDSYNVTIFTCPACGGEIISNDQGVADFCSYCGSSVVLEARLSKEKRPQKIIPFQKTAEDCKAAYKSKLKGALFAPRALKDPSFLENFRGIYIPYWSYSFNHRGWVSLTSKHEYRSGDYDITDYYHVNGNVDAHYEGICYDASASFDDSISEAIAPYDPKQMKDFVPSYLAGFYADVADVEAAVYLDEANNMANDETVKVIQRDREAGKYTISDDKSTSAMNKDLCTVIEEPVAAMLPVWFLTWRDRDRVAYMAVNGQTGKVAADIPIDVKKYLLAIVLCAIPLYFLVNLIFSFTAPTTLFLAGLFSLISGIIYYEETTSIRKKDNRELDKGFQHIRNMKKQEEARKKREEEKDNKENEMSVVEKYSRKGKQKMKEAKKQAAKDMKSEKAPLLHRINHFCLLASIIIAIFSMIVAYMTGSNIFTALFNRTTLNLLLIFGVFALWSVILMDGEEINRYHRPQRGIIGSQLAALLAAVINIIHPVWDLIYYFAIFFVYAGIFCTLIMVIRKYNLLITRPIPEFHNRGKEQP